jgi:hypothetical protein
MPQELTREQRLTQIEKLLESAVKLGHSSTARIDALTEKVEVNTEVITTQDLKIDRLTEQIGRATEIFIDSMSVMREM